MSIWFLIALPFATFLIVWVIMRAIAAHDHTDRRHDQ